MAGHEALPLLPMYATNLVFYGLIKCPEMLTSKESKVGVKPAKAGPTDSESA